MNIWRQTEIKVMHFMGYRVPKKNKAILRMDMKAAMAYLIITIILISGCTTTTHTITADKPTPAIPPIGFDQRLIELRQKIDTVDTSLQQAEGLVQTYRSDRPADCNVLCRLYRLGTGPPGHHERCPGRQRFF